MSSCTAAEMRPCIFLKCEGNFDIDSAISSSTDDELFIINFSLRNGFNLMLPHHEGESRKQCMMKETPMQRGANCDKKAKRKEKVKSGETKDTSWRRGE
jgi:hypothetical protein